MSVVIALAVLGPGMFKRVLARRRPRNLPPLRRLRTGVRAARSRKRRCEAAAARDTNSTMRAVCGALLGSRDATSPCDREFRRPDTGRPHHRGLRHLTMRVLPLRRAIQFDPDLDFVSASTERSPPASSAAKSLLPSHAAAGVQSPRRIGTQVRQRTPLAPKRRLPRDRTVHRVRPRHHASALLCSATRRARDYNALRRLALYGAVRELPVLRLSATAVPRRIGCRGRPVPEPAIARTAHLLCRVACICLAAARDLPPGRGYRNRCAARAPGPQTRPLETDVVSGGSRAVDPRPAPGKERRASVSRPSAHGWAGTSAG
jgi:hypothetical protein